MQYDDDDNGGGLFAGIAWAIAIVCLALIAAGLVIRKARGEEAPREIVLRVSPQDANLIADGLNARIRETSALMNRLAAQYQEQTAPKEPAKDEGAKEHE